MSIASRAALPTACLAAATALALAPDAAHAQRERCRRWSDGRWVECRVEERRRDDRRERRHGGDPFGPARQVALMVGAFRYALGGRETIPTAALRGDWRIGRLVRGELGVAYGFGDVPRVTGAGVIGSHVVAPTLGLTAELPTPWVRPYLGAAAGLVGRFDERGGERFVRPTLAVPVGVRAHLSPRLALRAETRFRFDQHPSGASAPNAEFTAGLSVGY